MFCTKCGKQIGDYDRLCSGCGQENFAVKSPLKQYKQPYESPVLSDLAFVLAVCVPLIGLIWSVFAGLNYKTAKYTKRCTVAIWISIISAIVQMIFFGILFAPIYELITPFLSDIVEGINKLSAELTEIVFPKTGA